MKLCKDCRYYIPSEAPFNDEKGQRLWSKCGHSAAYIENKEVDYVMGSNPSGRNRWCSDMRDSWGPCGPSGKLFQLRVHND